MKRYGNLFDKITDEENILLAYRKAKKGKMWQRKIRHIDGDRDFYLQELRESLLNKTFHTAPYREKWIFEPKKRLIYILPFYPDRIVQHALMNVVAPIWDKMMIADSYSCRIGKGQHAGSCRCMQFVKRNRFCLQCDVSKFYPSIHHETLKEIVARKIKDKDVLWLMNDIIDSTETPTNVPIGNYTSQWFGNLYLTELDMRVKHNYHVKDYLRYCDDFLFFDDDKEKLNFIAADVTAFLANKLKLTLSKCSLFHTPQGVDFLGYRHFPNGKLLVRKRTAKRIKRRLKALPYLYRHGELSLKQAMSVVASAKGWLKFANTYNLRQAMAINNLWDELKEDYINEGYAQTS